MDGSSQAFEGGAKKNFESVDCGLNFGAGYDFIKNVSAGVRYYLGLSNVFKPESGADSRSENSVLVLSVGYMF